MGTALERQTKTVSEVRNVAVSFVGKLDVGELLTGVPVVAEQDTSDLTIANQSVSTVELTINDKKVPIARAVQFKVTGGIAGVKYQILVTVATTASPAQTLLVNLILNVAGD